MEGRRFLDAVSRAGCVAILCGCALQGQTADSLFQQSIALAEQQKWAEAHTMLLDGSHKFPGDERFAVELGGVAFKLNQPAEAAEWLRRALRLTPDDVYAVDFLATVYYLQGNTEAAIEAWNRAGKPVIANVKVPEKLHVDSVLLDRAFAFAPGQKATLAEFRATRARIEGLGIFPRFQLRMEARDDGHFDAALTGTERHGFGSGRVDAAVTTLRGIGYRALRPEYANIHGRAMNVESLLRWDPNKRRGSISISAPFKGDPRYRVRAGVDVRDETWALRHGAEPVFGSLKLRRNAAFGSIGAVGDGTWAWTLGAEVSDRKYRDVAGVSPSVLSRGMQLKQASQISRALLRNPGHRFESSAFASAETGRIWAGSPSAFEKLQAGVAGRWSPGMRGNDYAMQFGARTGRTYGAVPFDELYIVGLERDNDIPLRAHIGTRDGRKGSAPMGRRYLVANFEIDKRVYDAGWWSLALSPFFDTGKTDAAAGLGPRTWLFDTGMQVKLRVLGVGFTFVYGKDLRTGANTFYATDRASFAPAMAGLPGRY